MVLKLEAEVLKLRIKIQNLQGISKNKISLCKTLTWKTRLLFFLGQLKSFFRAVLV